MIYLIGSSGYNEDRSGYIELLKIGYTKDTGLEKRLDHYYSHNPTCYLIATIPEGDTTDEFKLHAHFSKYKFKYYGNEWFDYNEEIIEFFKTHKTKQSLSCLLDPAEYKKEALMTYLNKATTYIIEKDLFKKDRESLYNFYINLKKNIEDFQSTKDLENYFINVDSSITPENIDELFQRFSQVEDETTKQLIELRKLRIYYRLKKLCEIKNSISKDCFSYILYNLGVCLPIYFYALSLKKIKALSYNSDRIIKHLKIRTFNIEILRNDMYSEFEVGKRYTKVYIKKKVGEIFEKYKYKKAPVASFIDNYFNIKVAKITLPDKTRVEGFEIVSKKN